MLPDVHPVGERSRVQHLVEGRVRPFNSGHLHWSTSTTLHTDIQTCGVILDGYKKAFLWFTVASTSVSADDTESITDYLNSGGNFKDVAIPVIYIKCLMDHKTLKVFMPALTKAIGEGKSHCTRTVVDTLSNSQSARLPCVYVWVTILR